MRSSELKGFSPWYEWPKSATRNAPYQPGVYTFRISQGQCVHRLKGESDIVYIGTTKKGKGTIRKRLNHHKSSCLDESYHLTRIQSALGVSFEVAWQIFKDHKSAEQHECLLLAKYVKEHIELPPANRQQSLKKFLMVLEYYQKATPEEQLALIERLKQQQQP